MKLLKFLTNDLLEYSMPSKFHNISSFSLPYLSSRYFPVNKYIKIFFVFAAFPIFFHSNPTMADESAELKAVNNGNSLFTNNLFRILSKEDNVIFSPISIHAVLSMLYQGTAGKTKETFGSVLNMTDQVASKGYQVVMKQLNSITNVTVRLASKIYLMENYKLMQHFKQVCEKEFLSGVEVLNFGLTELAAEKINGWVEKKTNEKIKNLIRAEDLSEQTQLVLANAFYFKGKWAQVFDVQATKTEKFYVNQKETIDVQMMHIKKKFAFKNDQFLDAKVLELVYENEDVSLLVVLPNDKNGIGRLKSRLLETNLCEITENMHKALVEVSLPKFKIEETVELEEPLTTLGLGEVFQNGGNFSDLVDSSIPLKISKFVHKAFIEVNEEGVEAAAATGSVIMKRSAVYPQEFVANAPFIIILFLKENNTKSILFFGQISKPNENIKFSYDRSEL